MKIAVVTPGISADARDNCIPSLRALVARLASRHEVHVFALHYPPGARCYALEGAAVHALGGNNRQGVARILLSARAGRALSDEHRRAPFDVVHAFWADEPGLVAARAGRRWRLPVVISVMGGELVSLPEIEYGAQRGRFARHAIARATAAGDWFTAGSRFAMEPLRARHSGIALRSTIVPLGVDTAKFQPAAVPGEARPVVLHVAALTSVKDQATLLRAFATVAAARPEVELHIAGDGPLKSALDRAVADLNLAARVRFLGEVPHDDLPALYRRATICALSSRHEAQSVVVLEAAACGVVTVGTAVGILPELAPVCRAVPVGDHQALAVAMAEALDDPEARRRLARVARNLVERAYSIEHTAAALCGIYERLVASRELRSTGVTSPDEQGARER